MLGKFHKVTDDILGLGRKPDMEEKEMVIMEGPEKSDEIAMG